MYVCPNCHQNVLSFATKSRAFWLPPGTCPSCCSLLVFSAVAALPGIFIMAGTLLAFSYASVRWKSSIPLWIALTVLLAIALATSHYGSLEVKAAQRSFLRRLWPIKHPEYYAATFLGIAAEFTVFVWYVLFDLKLQKTGWSLPGVVEYARYVFQYDESARPHFIAMALQPALSAALALAYLLGGAKRKIGAWVLLLAVSVNSVISAAIHTTWLWLSLAVLPFALLCVIDA
jgi:uncharacterized protein (DUF983 family)